MLSRIANCFRSAKKLNLIWTPAEF